MTPHKILEPASLTTGCAHVVTSATHRVEVHHRRWKSCEKRCPGYLCLSGMEGDGVTSYMDREDREYRKCWAECIHPEWMVVTGGHENVR